MASASEKLLDGIEKVCALGTSTVPNETHADEAWAVIKTGIVQSRKDASALDEHTREKMEQVLQFLVQRGAKKKASKGQVSECIRILLARPGWLCTAQENAKLLALLKQAFSGNAEILAALEASAPASPEEAAGQVSDSSSARISGIQDQLNYGFSVMQNFGWTFPHDPLGTKIDEATDGFKHFFDAITLLTTTSGKASVGGNVNSTLVDFEDHWEGVLRFLLSMYTCGTRSSYKARIKFVVVNLRAFSQSFRSQMPWRDLPWGSEAMPAEEAAEEAARIAAEEEANAARRKLEQEDFELALDLQAKEEAARQAADRLRKNLTTKDSEFARDLQDKEFLRLHPSKRPDAIQAAARRAGC